ncbi:hypothetical protein [Halorussus halophilus]|uniref:hypothetical protein n=1 Tax=Halorussus halophilus TaxID=2650975 RepID=UPI00130132AA|nr:hypothetical protein [Halorussus halophilus]
MNTNRRKVLGALAGVAVGGASATLFTRSAGATVETEFTADDLAVETADGTVRGLTVAPAGSIAWDGLEEPARSVSLTLHAKLDADFKFHRLATRTLTARGLHGETAYDFGTQHLLRTDGFEAPDFEAPDGETRTRHVRLRLSYEVFAGDDRTSLASGYADTAFSVTVENIAQNGDVSGEANSGVTAETESSAGETQTTSTAATADGPTTTTETTETTTTGTTDDGQ